eukprot:scaffold151162_cov20-Tisochrysis_lutea.AAC.1
MPRGGESACAKGYACLQGASEPKRSHPKQTTASFWLLHYQRQTSYLCSSSEVKAGHASIAALSRACLPLNAAQTGCSSHPDVVDLFCETATYEAACE